MRLRRFHRSTAMFLVAVGVICAHTSKAITMLPAKLPDPLKAGSECHGLQVMSWGSYIYSYPSKYDLVFFPYTNPNLLWKCPASGYVGFESDVETLPEAEKYRIAEYLAANPTDVFKLADTAMLDRLEAIYRLRDKDQAFWEHFYRLRAFANNDVGKGDRYRMLALAIAKQRLASGALRGYDKAAELYVVGYYSRRAGDVATSIQSFHALRKIKWKTENGEIVTGAQRFGDMISDVEAGKLDGACAQVVNEDPNCSLSHPAD